MTSRTTNGSVTKMVASTMPGVEKMTWKPLAASKLPNQPSLPVDEHERQADNDRRQGERQADGGAGEPSPRFDPRRTSVIAERTPNTVLSGTAIAARDERQPERVLNRPGRAQRGREQVPGRRRTCARR